MNKWREVKYYVIIAIIVCAYWLVTEFGVETPALSTRITTTTALIAAVTFWLQLKRTQNLNEANFIMNLNKQFLDRKEFTDIERQLELFANTVGDSKVYETVPLGLKLGPDGKDSQSLINYLVYMESLAAIIQQDVMHLGIVDDLFVYRFFLAINNPIVQKEELLSFAPYYQGCYKLAATWSKKLRKQKKAIPLDQFALCDIGNPLTKKVKAN